MFIPNSCIDILFDYTPLLKKAKLCDLPSGACHKQVAIIGAGAAGITAGHELLKLGLKPDIYEATDRIGGRLNSKPFDHALGNYKPFAELGAMRVPLSNQIFYHYAKKLGLAIKNLFPDPGLIDTLIHFENQSYYWHANQQPPTPFTEIKSLWELFINPIVNQIHEAWANNHIDLVKTIWQYHINQFENKTFFEVLKERSAINTHEKLGLFGSLGIGTGGFGSLYRICFLEILRIVVNAYEKNQYVIEEGIEEFTDRLYHLPISTQTKKLSLASLQSTKLNTTVMALDYNPKTKNPIIIYKQADNSTLHKKEYDAVIYTGSICAASLLNFSQTTNSGHFIFNSAVRRAIRNSYMLASSKTFIRTKEKFWRNNNMPSCILTDESPRAIYFLDYPHVTEGIVCLSYTWGIDSMRLSAIDPEERISIFQHVMKRIDPHISRKLQPLDGEIINVDWFSEKYQNGAFKLLPPGYSNMQKDLYFQFQSVLTPDDKGIYLAGDGISWSGGWVDGALYTALNSVYAVAKRFGAKPTSPNPLEQQYHLFEY